VSLVRYELDFYIPEDILHSDRRENLKSYYGNMAISTGSKGNPSL
jgi:hypothetical protein